MYAGVRARAVYPVSNISDLNQTVRLTVKLLTGLSLTLAVLKHTEAYFMVSFHAAAPAVF